MNNLLLTALVLAAVQVQAKSVLKPTKLSASLSVQSVAGSPEALGPRLVDAKMANVQIADGVMTVQILGNANYKLNNMNGQAEINMVVRHITNE